MALNTRIANTAAIAALDSLLAELNAGGAGSLEIFDGAIPTNCSDADAGTLLATLTLSATAFDPATDGTDKASAASAALAGESDAPASGTALYFRGKSGGGTVVIQGEVGTSGADLNLDTTTINSGDTVDIALGAWVVNLPEA